MFSGIQEILILITLIFFMFLIPKFFNNKNKQTNELLILKKHKFSWKTRLAIVISILWPAAVIIICVKPYEDYYIPYFIIAFGPILFLWCFQWIISGIKSSNKKSSK